MAALRDRYLMVAVTPSVGYAGSHRVGLDALAPLERDGGRGDAFLQGGPLADPDRTVSGPLIQGQGRGWMHVGSASRIASSR